MTDATNTPEDIAPDGEQGPETASALAPPAPPVKPAPIDYDERPRIPLKDYEVAVWADNNWRTGFINQVEKLDGVNKLLYVHTERGPVTVASDRSIRPA
jgi:hypothetical protein